MKSEEKLKLKMTLIISHPILFALRSNLLITFPPPIMGIDIYSRWKQQSSLEEKSQITAFDTTAGKTGYLREAYHGGPYVTKYLVAESFAEDMQGDDLEHGPQIPAAVLRERLPTAVLLAMYRNHVVYKEKPDPGTGDINKLSAMLSNIFTKEVRDRTHEEVIEKFGQEQIDTAKEMILREALPDYAQSFVDFVELCEAKEKETGEPCRIYASY